MTQIKHTPGPWELEGQKATYAAIGAEDHEEFRLEKLKELGKLKFEAVSVRHNDGQAAIIPLDESSIENAWLVSASPELFEAGKECAEALAHCMGKDYAPVVKMRAAIKKAETGK